MKVVALFLGIFFLSGCLVRTYTLEKPRVDTQVAGNQGYLSGTPAPDDGQQKRLGRTRKLSVMEIEFGRKRPAPGEQPQEAEFDSFSAAALEDPFIESDREEENEDFDLPRNDNERLMANKDDFQWYVIQKDETLQKISHKFYKTTKKWLTIFDYNKELLKNPDKIYPGMKIKIPVLD